MITPALYQDYFTRLLKGDRQGCARIVQDLLNQGIDIKVLYADLFQKSLYEVGKLWELNQMLAYIQQESPDLVGLSVSVYFNMPELKTGIEAIRSDFRNLDILVGGQAFHWGGTDMVKQFNAIQYDPSLDQLQTLIAV